MNIALAITAAGRSLRFGADKLSYPFEDSNIGRRSISLYSGFSFSDKVIVLNSAASDLFVASAELGFRQVINPIPEEGLSHSVFLAVQSILSHSDPDGILFAAADMPFLTANTVTNIIQLFEEHPQSICAPVSNSTLGKPVLFPRRFYQDLMSLSGDTGGRNLLKRYASSVLTVQTPASELLDIDTKEEAKAYLPHK